MKMNSNNYWWKVFILVIILSSCFNLINAYNHNDVVNDCCSVTLQVSDNITAWGFRRDSPEDDTLQISKIKFDDEYAVVQKRTDGDYFAHVTIFEDGWGLSIGGTSDGTLNKELQELGYNISKNGSISMDDIDQALTLLNMSGMGHFLIKSPDGSYGFCIYNEEQNIQNISRIGKLKEGEYLSVPNGADYFQEGNILSVTKSNAVDEVILLEGTDRWGVNRKDILSYLIETGDNNINVGVYGTYDDGNLINRSSPAKPDDIIFNEKEFISGTSLPIVPGKMFIGQINMISNQDPNPSTVSEISNDSDVKEIVESSSPLTKTGFPLIALSILFICGFYYIFVVFIIYKKKE
ncbi:MAG: hypothetical protein LBD03_02365 [Methanobrevibacter sp.]|nr:hypothetical protein [Candidatus Methanovirga procula]